MPDKQQRFLLGRLIVEEYRDQVDPFILLKRNAAGCPFLLYGLHMAPYFRGILRLHRGIQCAEIRKAASSQRIGICFQRLLVHKQHITPAYDMTFTTNLDGAAYENVHSMNISGKDNGITEDDLLQFARQNGIKNAKRIIEEVSLAISHFYDYATNYQIDEYWKDRIEEHLSGLVSPLIGETMKHYLPTIVEPYETEDGFLVSEINIIENTRHDFRIEAVINGKRQKYIAGRKSDLAAEIIAKGRNKMTVENKKELLERLLLPLARR